MATFAFYLFKWRDKSKPSVMWNEYRGQVHPEMDLWKENYHFYILPIDLRSRKYLNWDQFWGSYGVYASILDSSPHLRATRQHWSNIPFQKCGEQEWAKALPDTDKNKKWVLENGICLNPLKMVKGPLSRFKETFPIRGGNGLGSQRVMIDFYQCIPGGAPPTKGIPKTCDTQWPGGVLLRMNIYEKTVNVKDYEQPVDSAHVEVDRFTPSETLRFKNVLHIKQLDLYTDVGVLVKDWKKEQVPTIKNFKRTTSERSPSNIATNFGSQGKVITTDF